MRKNIFFSICLCLLFVSISSGQINNDLRAYLEAMPPANRNPDELMEENRKFWYHHRFFLAQGRADGSLARQWREEESRATTKLADDDPSIPTPKVNNAPSVPSLTAPIDGLQCTENPLVFSWNKSSDPDGDAVSYSIQLATINSFSKDLQVRSISDNTTTLSLIKGVAYYWRVNAKDTKNKSSEFSPVRKFYSEGEGVSNHIPYAATLIRPALNSNITDSSATLEWSSSDIDNDSLLYDVYAGVVNPPPLVLENSDSTSYTINLSAGTTYYWKIVVKDDVGGEAIGQIWSFKSN